MSEKSFLYPVNNEVRRAQKLDGLWDFQFDKGSEGVEQLWPEKGLPRPIQMPVPGSFSDLFTEAEGRDYVGDFWYATDFYIQKVDENTIYEIRFGSVTHRCKVYCNGILVDSHEGGFTAFSVDVTEAIKKGRNTLFVLVNNELNSTSIPCGMTMTDEEGNKVSIPSFDFFNYSGIHRTVWLTETPKERILDYELTYALDGENAEIHYKIVTTGEHPVSLIFAEEDGTLAGRAWGKEGTLTIPKAHLWNVRAAYLYQVRIVIEEDGEILDCYDAKAGIRTVEVKGEEIQINGKPVYLKGYGKHEDFHLLGRGFHYSVAKRDFECMKWSGANCFRTSHYPYADEWYQMADEEGFLIIDEVPGVGLMHMFHVAAAGSGASNRGFFGSCPDLPLLAANHMQALKEMIARDKNHPSVFSWSIFNEAETTTEISRDYFSTLFAAAKELDPEKRPVTGVLEKTSSPEACKCYPLMDFICLNRYYGWYISGGDFKKAESGFREELDAWKEKELHVPFVFTEFGTDTLETLHKLPSVMWSQEYQQEYMELYFQVFDSYSFIQGELVWNFADFQTGQGIIRVNGNKKGIFTRDRQPKAAAFHMKKRWEQIG